MKLFKFQSILFCLLIIGAGLAISGSANAARCNAGQFGGDCKTACDATEANILEVYTKEAPDMSQCIGYEFCCVKRKFFVQSTRSRSRVAYEGWKIGLLSNLHD